MAVGGVYIMLNPPINFLEESDLMDNQPKTLEIKSVKTQEDMDAIKYILEEMSNSDINKLCLFLENDMNVGESLEIYYISIKKTSKDFLEVSRF